MDLIFHFFKSCRIKLTRTKNSKKFEQSSSKDGKATLGSLPYEILDKILKDLSKTELLKCRLVSSSLCHLIDHLYIRNWKLTLNDKLTSYQPLSKLSFEVADLIVRRLTSTIISKELISQSFMNSVTRLEITDCISSKNFKRLMQNLQCLRVLTLNSMALGGNPLCLTEYQATGSLTVLIWLHVFHNPRLIFTGSSFLRRSLQYKSDTSGLCFSQQYVNMRRSQSQKEKVGPLSLHELHLKLDYVSTTCKSFSSTNLITNLLEIHAWNTPRLQTITFTVEPTSLSEQFYFSLDLFLLSIPVYSYRSLKNLKIYAPKLRPSNFHPNVTLKQKGMQSIQLEQFELRNNNTNYATLSESFLTFLKSQQNLKTLVLNIQKPSSRSLFSTLKEHNPNLQNVNVLLDKSYP